MAENKKSVLLYCDLIHTVEKMDDQTAGQFFKHYLRYVNDLNPKTDNMVVDISFESVKQNLKRDLKKWEQRAENSRKNGSKGGRPKTQETQQDKIEPKEPVKVTVTVKDTVTDNVNVKVKDIIKVYSKEVNDCFKNCLKYFDEHLHPKTPKEKENWLDTIDKLNRLENMEFHLIQKIVKKTREDEFWSTNFLSITKLRKKNKEQIMYIVVFYEKFKTNGKTNSKETGSTVSQEYLQSIADTLQSD